MKTAPVIFFCTIIRRPAFLQPVQMWINDPVFLLAVRTLSGLIIE